MRRPDATIRGAATVVRFDCRTCLAPWLLAGIVGCNALLGIEPSRQVGQACDAGRCAGDAGDAAADAMPSVEACSPREDRCVEHVHEICSADSTFAQAEICAGDCAAGGCVPCQSGVERCADSAIERCDDDGAYLAVTACEFDCNTDCGGFPVGRFRVRRACSHIDREEVPLSGAGVCTPEYVSSVQRPQGTLEIGADLTVTGDLVQHFEQQYTIPAACLDTELAGLRCADLASALAVDRCIADGTACDCTLTRTQDLSGIFDGLSSSIAAGRYCAGEDGDLRLQLASNGNQNVFDLERIRSDAHVKAGAPQANAEFGYEVALDGDTLLVGAPFEDEGAGAAYVFIREADQWRPAARLSPEPGAAGDHFGADVAIVRDTLVVSAPDHDGPASGTQVDDAGAVYVFRRASDGSFAREAYLRAPQPEASAAFGWEIAFDGTRLAVGAPNESSDARGVGGESGNVDRPRSGAVFVFGRGANDRWALEAYLKASNADAGDFFGDAVALYDDLLLVGAEGEDGAGLGVNGDREDNGAADRGAAYVFRAAAGGWREIAYLKPTQPGFPAHFGTAVAIDGRTALIGASRDGLPGAVAGDSRERRELRASGAAYVFAIRNGAFEPGAYLKADAPQAEDLFGYRVAVLGSVVLVSSLGLGDATNEPDAGAAATPASSIPGAVYEYFRGPNGWALRRRLQSADPAGDVAFGSGLSISGATIAIGAHLEDAAAMNGDGPMDPRLTNAGAVYTYR